MRRSKVLRDVVVVGFGDHFRFEMLGRGIVAGIVLLGAGLRRTCRDILLRHA